MRREKATFYSIAAAVTVVCLLSLVWMFVLRERSARRLYVEYEVYRALTSLTDMIRDSEAVLPSDDRLIGFALYRSDGTRLYAYGRTPDSLGADVLRNPEAARRLTASSFVLVRPFGMEAMRRQPPGGGRPDRPGAGMMMAMGHVARYAYIEYSLNTFLRSQRILALGAVVLSAALAGAYFLLIRLYRKNQDLREREYRTRELVQLGEAARTLAHEIKNPLGIIRVQNALLRRTAVAESQDGFSIIDEEVRRLGNLVDRIREFLKSGEGHPEKIAAGPFLRAWAPRYGERVRLDILFPDNPEFLFDPDRFANILDNLVRNALESMETASGPIFAEVTAFQRHGRLHVSVSDRGMGVSVSDSRRLFEPFFTTKEKGSGIGLALCRKWIESSEGKLLYRPREGGGSVFELELPLTK